MRAPPRMQSMKKRGYTLLELIVVVAILSLLAALLLPSIHTSRALARRASCANNLRSMGCALMMYADVPSYECFPVYRSNGRAEPLPSLGILYRDYVADFRCFSCAGLPTIQQLSAMQPTIGSTRSLAPLSVGMTHYAYDSGNKGTGYKPHTPKDGMAIILADFTAAGRNSDNHGPGLGQNCLRASGSVEWFETLTNTVASGTPPLIDADITTDGTLDDQKWNSMKSFISQE